MSATTNPLGRCGPQGEPPATSSSVVADSEGRTGGAELAPGAVPSLPRPLGPPRFREGRDRLVGRVEMDSAPHPHPTGPTHPTGPPKPPPPLGEFPPPGIDEGAVHDVPREYWPQLSATCRTWPRTS